MKLQILQVLIGTITYNASMSVFVLDAPRQFLKAVHALHVAFEVGGIAVCAVAHVARVTALHVVHDHLVAPQIFRGGETRVANVAVLL